MYKGRETKPELGPPTCFLTTPPPENGLEGYETNNNAFLVGLVEAKIEEQEHKFSEGCLLLNYTPPYY